MLSEPGHRGPPIEPAELWAAWNSDPLVWLAIFAAGMAYVHAWRLVGHRRAVAPLQRRAFLGGLAVVWLALVSPIDAMSASLSSAHMVQHLLLTTVAAPLLVAGAPMVTLWRALPRPAARHAHRWRTSTIAGVARWLLERPAAAAVPSVVALWAWHVPAVYEAALGNAFVHALEHVTFLAAALLSWAAILAAGRRRTDRPGRAVLVLFGLSLQCGLLGVLLTFSRRPWYPSYVATAEAWGLTPLADQQLAGVIMWVPAGGVYLVVALWLLVRWINVAPTAAAPAGSAP